MIRKIIKKAKRLRQISTEVKDFSKIPQLLSDMKETLIANRGVGLAAIQIGVPKRVIWVTAENKTNRVNFLYSMINPVIVDSYNDGDNGMSDSFEGCLSFPGRFGNIKRYFYVHVDFQDPKGEHKKAIFEGLEAFITAHEIDHLDGIICVDKFF